MIERARVRRALPALAALGAGATVPLAFAPLGWWPFALIAPAVLLYLLRRCASRQALAHGWLFGLGMFGGGTSWVYVSIHDYGDAPVPLAGALTFLFCGGLALIPAACMWLWARFVRDHRFGIALGFPAAWFLAEWLREWFLTGFPWLYLGDTQIDGPLGAWVPVVGTLGVGLIIAFSASALCIALPLPRAGEGPGERVSWLPIAIAGVIWLAAWPLSRIEWTEASGEPLTVAMVQGNIPQLMKWDPDHLERTLTIYADMSEPLWGTDLVVWPESAVPAYLDLVTEYLSEQATRAQGSHSALLLGVPTRDGDSAEDYLTYNSVAELGADSGLYHKRHLVPFGEYVPLESLLRGLIAFFDLPMSGFASGPDEQALLRAHGVAIGTFVCYEIAYPELVRSALPEAGLLLTVSNDTWFGASAGPLQHLAIARMRALENGRDLIRATNNGVTALIDAQGRVLARGAQFTREVVRGTVQPRTGLTPYARFGSWPVLLVAALMMLVPAVSGRQMSG